MPKVSVIVPCYNVEKYVSKCLDTLINQTLKDIEIICIDDKSTDNTLKVLRKYAKKDKRIKLIEQKENQGVARARNEGIKQAQGEYIGFVDPDDYVDLNFYEKLYNTAKTNNYDVVKGGLITKNYLNEKQIESDLNKKILKNPLNFCAEHYSAIYKKTFLNRTKLVYPENIMTGQDSAFLSKLAVLKPSLFINNEVFYHYVNRPGSLDSKTLTHNKVLSRIKMLDYKLKVLCETTFSSEKNRVLFTKKHVLDNFCYTFNKSFNNDNDKHLLFNWLVKANISKRILINTFGRRKTKAILQKSYEKFIQPKRYIFLLSKKRFSDGYRRIYFCGIKILSYKRD